MTKTRNCAVQRDGAQYWESVHKGVLLAQKAAQVLADTRRRTFSVYKWTQEEKAALFVSVHKPGE
jgi:hypothetical protein